MDLLAKSLDDIGLNRHIIEDEGELMEFMQNMAQ